MVQEIDGIWRRGGYSFGIDSKIEKTIDLCAKHFVQPDKAMSLHETIAERYPMVAASPPESEAEKLVRSLRDIERGVFVGASYAIAGHAADMIEAQTAKIAALEGFRCGPPGY